MIKKFTLSVFTVIFLLSAVSLKAQIYYDFTTASPTSNSYSNITAGPITNGNNNGTTPVISTTSASSGYSGASGGGNAGAAAVTGGFTALTSTYFEVTLTPTAGNSVTLTGISFGSRSTGTGPLNASVRTSVDAYASDQATFNLLNNSTWALNSANLTVTGTAGTPVTLRIYGYNGGGSPSANTANWRIDDLTINPNALPLSLTSYKASLISSGSVQLNWTSENEKNVKEYAVERSSDGNVFTTISLLTANNASFASYSFTDTKPADGPNYYRLKMIDKDGAFKYSSVMAISNRKLLAAKLFPNPAIDNVSVTHGKALKGAALRVVSIDGRQLQSFNVAEGAVQTSLQVGNLVKGNYMLVFVNGVERITTQFIKL